MTPANTNAAPAGNNSEIRFLQPVAVDKNRKKYCRFKKSGIKYIDYKDPEFLKKFLNEQGKILPRRITGTSLKYQRKVAQAVKRARHLAVATLCNGYVEIIFKAEEKNLWKSYSKKTFRTSDIKTI